MLDEYDISSLLSSSVEDNDDPEVKTLKHRLSKNFESYKTGGWNNISPEHR